MLRDICTIRHNCRVFPGCFPAFWPAFQFSPRILVRLATRNKSPDILRTGMANSFSRPGKVPAGSFTHSLSATKFAASGAIQRIERDGLEGEYKVAWTIGSGSHALGFLVQVGDYCSSRRSPIIRSASSGIWLPDTSRMRSRILHGP